jgi:hypothetical protein
MEIIKGNWYECVNADDWEGIFEVGKIYYSSRDFYLSSRLAPFKISFINAEKDFKITTNTRAHYDNSNCSLYKFCEEQKLNSYEFNLIKRIMRCRKKGQFEADLQSKKLLIDLYLKEYETDKKSN